MAQCLKFRERYALWVRVTTLIFGSAAIIAQGQSVSGAHFNAVMPLGSDSIVLQPAKQRLNMLISVECPELEKVIVQGTGKKKTVTDAAGHEVKLYPSDISFRFTIGSRTSTDETSPNDIETKVTADHFQSNLHFRLKVFHGMETKTYKPVEARMIGVPAHIPYDERIYHLDFKLKDVPVEDRMMLEVLDEEGTRVAKFQLQLM